MSEPQFDPRPYPPVPQYGYQAHQYPLSNQWYQQQTAYQPLRLRSNRSLSVWVIVASACFGLFRLLSSAIVVWAGPIEFPTLDPTAPPVNPFAVFTGRQMVVQLTSSLQSLAGLGALVATCMWLTIAYRNARLVAPLAQRHGEAWVWISWIIPIVNFWFPKQVIDDCLTVTEGRLTNQYPHQVRARTGWWWGTYIASSLLAGIATVVTMLPIAPRAVGAVLQIISAVLLLVALALWVKVVLRVTSVQERLVAQAG